MLICGDHYSTEVEQDAAMEENSKLQVKVVQFLSQVWFSKKMEKFPFRSFSFSLIILISDIVLLKLAHE